MSHYRIDRRDVDFALFEHLNVESLSRFEKFSAFNRELYDMVLSEAYKFATEVLAPINAPGDRAGCTHKDGAVTIPEVFEKAYKRFVEGGWVAPHHAPEMGGQGLPVSVFIAATEMFMGACTSFVFYPGLGASAGHLIEAFGSKELVDRFVTKLYSGQWGGTMCLTEPQAGSAVGDLKTAATDNGDGTFSISGSKIFITGGDHQLNENIIHLVLARVKGDPDGIKGISLFLVPKLWVHEDGSLGELNDVTVAGIEHKMGINAASTCTMSFGDNGHCRGYLIGEQRRGINAMFQMMNEARMITGAQGMALGNAAYQAALGYAKERVQGTSIKDFRNVDADRVTIDQHPDVRRMLITMKAYGEGLRALIYKAAFLADQLEATSDEATREAINDQLGLLTPVAKAFGSDKGFKITEDAIQTYGGYGYIREYPVEQYMRDVKIASLYEGTNGIQSMDLLGRKLPMKGGMVFMGFMQELNAFVDSYKEHAELAKAVASLDAAKNAMGEAAFGFAGAGASDPEFPMLNAVPFLDMVGHVMVGHLLLEQAAVAQGKLEGGVDPASNDGRFYANKVRTAKFFALNLMPHVVATARAFKNGDRSALELEL